MARRSQWNISGSLILRPHKNPPNFRWVYRRHRRRVRVKLAFTDDGTALASIDGERPKLGTNHFGANPTDCGYAVTPKWF
jgi:hypothetical protein